MINKALNFVDVERMAMEAFKTDIRLGADTSWVNRLAIGWERAEKFAKYALRDRDAKWVGSVVFSVAGHRIHAAMQGVESRYYDMVYLDAQDVVLNAIVEFIDNRHHAVA